MALTIYQRDQLAQLSRSDRRYEPEAYEFVCHAVIFAQKRLLAGRKPTSMDECHLSGRQVLDGIREFALDQFGRLAAVVFRCWGIHRTDDLGQIIFRLIEAQILQGSQQDSLDDYHDAFDFDEVFVDQYRIEWEEI